LQGIKKHKQMEAAVSHYCFASIFLLAPEENFPGNESKLDTRNQSRFLSKSSTWDANENLAQSPKFVLPRVDVMITIFGEKFGVFSKSNVMIKILHNLTLF
jgi:hypothetical protein